MDGALDKPPDDNLADFLSCLVIQLTDGAVPSKRAVQRRLSGERSESPVSARVHHNGSSAAGAGMEQEKRIRREIANSNERRRMQSINAGFQSLRTLLPHHEGEKLSKAAILQQTAEYIYQLEQEKTRLLSQNCHLKRLLNQHEGEASANKKRKTDSDLEVDTNVVSGATNDLIDVRVQLDRERRLRMILEEQVRSLESQLYPERIREITQQVQLQYQQREEEENGAVITPMRREVLNGSAETVAAVANLQVVSANSLQPVAHTETVIATVTNSPPNSPSSRLPSILEAAIKAEPKVEVERLPSPHAVATTQEERMSQARVYLASTSRQNLETIVEAIRHLEGDNLFSDSVNEGGSEGVGDEPQEAPLALTKHTSPEKQQLIKVKMNQYLQFQQQQRPGVIVVKQHT
ncbi:transcription factor AP-4 isoform X3 [Cimex lectularius]|uniref:BHLH domain-containing protein n=1 Tax=Cimex lectularius TaxID=79782 RepID=A0A8I6RS92_CIMLE|nr:transcription factor AP-4 isoform X3 [Cimex lectularius]